MTGRRIFESVLALVSALMFKEFLSFLYLSQNIIIYLAALLSVIIFLAGSINIYIKDELFDEEYIKPIVVKVDNTLIYQTIRFQARRLCSILVNLAGAVLPMAVSAIALIIIAMVQFDLLLQVVLNTFLLTFLYHKLSILIKDKGVGVPIAVSIAVTVILSVSTALCLNLSTLMTFALTFTSSAIALLIGVDLMNLGRVIFFNVRRIIIGGMGPADALLLIPATSALVTVNVIKTLFGFIA